VRFLNKYEWLQAWLPQPVSVGWRERVRACCGALLGIFLTGLLTTYLFSAGETDIIWLISPIGATAVLLFATPASPLAQPWHVFAGNLISTFIGVTCARWIPIPIFACAAAVSLSIAAMLALRCLHPPGGALALTAVLGSPAMHAAGYGLMWFPIGINTFLLLVVAIIFHNATGHRYPHRLPVARAAQTAAPLLHITRDDLVATLRDNDEILDITIDDLDLLIRKAESHALARMASAAR
jgi:CBS domain-containing membrane protein